MLPDRVSNPGPLTYESGALPIALRGPAALELTLSCYHGNCSKSANNSVVCHDGDLDNLRNYFMFLVFK